MPNKREFKKYVNAIGASICTEMMGAYYNVDGVDRNAIANSVEKVLGAVAAAKSHANVFFDKGLKAFDDHKQYSHAKHAFFKSLFDKIIADFSTEINAAVADFNKAVPASVKEENKKAVND